MHLLPSWCTILGNHSQDICRAADASRAKYDLRHTVRVHLGNEDEAFGCMGAKEDDVGLPGVFLQTCVVKVAGKALALNLKRLGRLVLPLTEKVCQGRRAGHNLCMRLMQAHQLHAAGAAVHLRILPVSEQRRCTTVCMQAKYLRDNTYIPRFNACFEHYLMHTGGRGVLDALTHEPLLLSEKQLSGSRQTLRKFGNTSAASTWCAASMCWGWTFQCVSRNGHQLSVQLCACMALMLHCVKMLQTHMHNQPDLL